MTEKMIKVNGKLVPMSKRIEAMKFGEEIAAKKDASLAATRNAEIKKMREDGWTDDEISQHFIQQEVEEARSHGFIEVTTSSHRTTERHVTPYGPGMMIH